MATVTSYTKDKIDELIDATIVDADVVGGELVFTKEDGTTINLGTVGGGVTKVTAFPTAPPPTDGDLVIRTDQIGDPMYKFTDGVWELQPRMGAQNVPFLKARASVAQAIPSATWTSITFDLEDADTNTLHSTVTNTNRITIVTPGVYAISASVGFVPGGGLRSIRFIKNGDPTVPLVVAEGLDPPDANNSGVTASTHARLAAGDYVEVQVNQNSGGSLNTITGSQTTNQVSAVWLGGAGQTVDERGVPAGQIIKTSAAIQGIPNTAYTPVTFNTTGFDTDSMTLVGNRLTIKTPGLYRIVAELDWTANTTGSRQIALRKNNGSYLGFVQGPPGAAGGGTYQQVVADAMLAAGDFITLEGWQSSAGSLNADGAWLSAVLLGTGKTVTPFAKVYPTVAQSIIGDGSTNILTFDAEEADNDGIHDQVSNKTRLTCRTAGVYLVTGNLLLTAGGGSNRWLYLHKNGSPIEYGQYPAISSRIGITTLVELAVGDYMEFGVGQDSGGALATSTGAAGTKLSMVKVGAPIAGNTGIEVVEGVQSMVPYLQNGWVAAAGKATPGFYKDRGRVYLTGVLDGSAATGNIACALPAGYAPPNSLSPGVLAQGCNAAGTAYSLFDVEVTGPASPPAGRLNIFSHPAGAGAGGNANAKYLSLEGLSFRL